MIKKLIALFVVVGGIVLVGLLVLAKLGEITVPAVSIEGVQARTGIPVRVVQPVFRPFRRFLYCDGDVVAYDRAMVRAKIAEVVEDVRVRAGDRVNRGDVLVTFRSSDLEASVVAARAAYEEARKRKERHAELLEQEVISKERFDEVTTALDLADASLKAAESRLAFAVVRSPIDGVVEQRSVEIGEYKQAKDELMSIVSLEAVDVRARVPERYVGTIEEGMTGEFRLRSSSLGDTWFEATVSRVSPASMDPNRFFEVYLHVVTAPETAAVPASDQPTPEADSIPRGSIRPGMYCEARFVTGRSNSHPGVPSTAIVYSGAERFIYTIANREVEVPGKRVMQEDVDNSFGARLARGVRRITRRAVPQPEPEAEKREATVARRVNVTLGLRDGELVQILDAELSRDDLVVANPSDDLRDGAMVSVVEKEGE